MNLEQVLTGYRERVQPAWSAATAHPDFPASPGDPAGQCGVTSAWLQKRLQEDHGMQTLYCVGRVGRPSHCWLETGNLVIDLTVDQFLPGQPYAAALWQRWEAGLNYRLDYCLPLYAVASDPVAPRLKILEEAL